MSRPCFLGRLGVAALAGLLLPACGSSDSGGSAPSESAQVQSGPLLAPDFLLVDVNPKSKTHDESVSPRDFMGLVPGFYFGHAN